MAATLYRGQLVLAGNELYNFHAFAGRKFKGQEAALAWQDAAFELTAIAQSAPERPEAYYYLARLRRFLGDDAAAMEAASQALEADPAFVPAEVLWEEISGMSLRVGSESLEELLGRYRGTGGWQVSWLLAYRAARDKHWAEAAEAYGRILRWRQKRGAEPYVGSAVQAFMGRGLARFAAARALWPRFPEAGLLLGKAYYKKGQKDEAERVFENLVEESVAEERSELASWVALLYSALSAPEKRDAWLMSRLVWCSARKANSTVRKR